ncbi:MAG: dethiobiotin synthase [Chthoniobacteraceae bacterium]|jgi:dethiobiotin synthetase
MNYFLTGTDTGVGKTYVASLLIRALRKAGFDTVGLKPICCGDRADAEALRDAANGELTLDDVNPVWFRFPAAPYTAAMAENRLPDLDQIRERFARIRKSRRSLIAEGVGGWLVPITRDFFVADLAAEFGLPVVVVAANKLGVLNHTLLTVRAIRERGLDCAGVILNNITPEPDPVAATNRSVLEYLLEVPVLYEVSYGQAELELGVA